MPVTFRRETGGCIAYGPLVRVQVTVDDRDRSAGTTIAVGGTRYDYAPGEAPTAAGVEEGTHALSRELNEGERDELIGLLRLIERGQ